MQSLREEFLKMLSDYQGILHKVSLVYFSNASDREDNFQEIVYQLWKSYPKIKNKDSIGSWIYSVSINTSISRLKKEKHAGHSAGSPEVPDGSDIIDEIIKNESLRILLDAISELDEISKSVMLLYLEEKSYDEIAIITGISSSNVGVRISRAKKILKENLNSKGYGK